MTGKQRAMVSERKKDLTAPNSEIIKRAGYNAKTVFAQSQQYIQNMKIPEIANKLEPVAEEMEDTLIADVRRYRDSEKLGERTLANDTARWIHDKARGKATQRTEVTSTGVTLTIDLTSALGEPTDTATEVG